MVLPEPVGPVAKIMPRGLLMFLCKCSRASPWKPSSSRLNPLVDSGRSLITTFSPSKTGKIETRREYRYSGVSILNLPSWGSLCSSNFRLESTLILATIPVATCLGRTIASRKIPSILYLTTTSFSIGSICISEARCKMACLIKVSTIFTIGRSSAAFLRSSAVIASSLPPDSATAKASVSPLIISPNSACRLFWYWVSACFIEAIFVSRGKIFKFDFLRINSMVSRSSGSSMATSRALPLFLKATILLVLAIGSGIIERTFGSKVSFSKPTKGIPKI